MKQLLRLDRYLSETGIGTRSEIKIWIRKGLVALNGGVVKSPETKVNPDTDEVTVNGSPIRLEALEYYMLNKPAGVVSATEDCREKTVLDLITQPKRKDLFPVGRLDKDTEGLLLITNDGPLAHSLLSPKKHVDKVYYARIDGLVTEQEIRRFEEGLVVDSGLTALPARLEILKTNADTGTSEIRLTIHEGKFHQVKRMFEAVDRKVTYLKRLSMGPLVLDEILRPGEFRKLTESEISALQHVTAEKEQTKEEHEKGDFHERKKTSF